jgi:apolipoprotein N-acyltransferase
LKDLKIKDALLFCPPFIGSALMLTVIQPTIDLSLLAWVSLVPFILVCSPAAKPKALALGAYAVSVCYWLGNLYWIFPITVLGWAAFCLYIALLWPILALCLRYCRIKKIPLFLAAAILVVGTERLQGFFLGGFFWRFLGHSQYSNITIIQIADIFGAAGVSFLIGMVNGLVAELLICAKEKNIFKITNLTKTAFVCAAVVAAIFYGRWRINQTEESIEAGPVVASLQSNVPQSVKRSGEASNVIFDDLMQSSKESAEAGAELIVWPETMVQAILDEDAWPFLASAEDCRAFDNKLRQHSKDTAFVLAGAYGGELKYNDDLSISLERFNSAFLYRADGQKDKKRYDKIHLVLFGEYLPFKKKVPWLYNLLMKFTPYNYDYSLDAGSKYPVFEMPQKQRQLPYKFGVIICYEGTIPKIARRFAIDDQGRKQLDWLVNISNDGWFVKFEDGKVSPSTELPQHAAIYVFRAIENRLAILRSVNTGISCLIDSAGRIKNGYLAGNLPKKAIDRKGCAGWFVDRVSVDTRITFFSKFGQWLDFCCALGLALLIIVMLSERIIRKKSILSLGQRNEKQI